MMFELAWALYALVPVAFLTILLFRNCGWRKALGHGTISLVLYLAFLDVLNRAIFYPFILGAVQIAPQIESSYGHVPVWATIAILIANYHHVVVWVFPLIALVVILKLKLASAPGDIAIRIMSVKAICLALIAQSALLLLSRLPSKYVVGPMADYQHNLIMLGTLPGSMIGAFAQKSSAAFDNAALSLIALGVNLLFGLSVLFYGRAIKNRSSPTQSK
jgi:hypothetical protein